MSILNPKPLTAAAAAAQASNPASPLGAALSATILDQIEGNEYLPATFRPLDGAREVPWPAGLVAFWDFAEDAAPFIAKAGAGSYPLEDAGAAAVTKAVTNGPFGPGIQVTNSAPRRYLRVPAAGALGLNVGARSESVTVLAWVSQVNTGGACVAGVWHEGGANPARSYGLWFGLPGYGGDSKVLGHISKTGGASPGLPYSRDYSASRRQVADNDMRFWGFTYDGAQAISYLDGLADSYTAYTEPGAPNGQGLTYDKNPYLFDGGLNPTIKDFLVGVADPANSLGHMQGVIGGLAVFDRALTQAEIMAIHQATTPSTTPLFKHDMVRPVGTGTPFSPGTKFAARLQSFSQARDTTAATNAATDQTWYSGLQSGGKPYLAYDIAAAATNDVKPAIAWIDYVKSLRSTRLTRFTWLMNNATTTSKVRLAVRIGTTWYATAQQFSCASTHTAADWSAAEAFTFTMTRAAASWRDMTLNPGVALSLGGVRAADLPAGELTGYGFFADEGAGAGGAIRITDLKVYC